MECDWVSCALGVYCWQTILNASLIHVHVKFGCSSFIVFRRWRERPNERVITVGIGWVLLASATSGYSGYMKLTYCSSAKGLQ